jgi:zinc/manganese transport system ATP-binding protein
MARGVVGVVIRFEALALGYEGRPVVTGLDGIVRDGALLAIAGPNGGGKSTLMKALAGRLRALSGALAFDGIHRKDIAYLPQAADLDRSFPLSVFDLVSAGAWRSAGILGGFGKRKTDAVHAAIAAVGLKGRESAVIGSLSGGQLQRALFARLMVQDARLILLDEPFAAVDQATVEDLTLLMERWNTEGRTIMAVLHDLDLIRAHFPETLLIARGPIAWGPTAEVLAAQNLLAARRACEHAQASAAA